MYNCVELNAIMNILMAVAADGNHVEYIDEFNENVFVVTITNSNNEGFSAMADKIEEDGIWVKAKKIDPSTTWQWSDAMFYPFTEAAYAITFGEDNDTYYDMKEHYIFASSPKEAKKKGLEILKNKYPWATVMNVEERNWF